jgi:RNA recognition motif-containing protein
MGLWEGSGFSKPQGQSQFRPVSLGEKMETKLYVGNLSYTATEEELQALFSQAGTVQSVMLIKDRDTGRSKGFAFVEMSTQDEAQKAISQFHGAKLQDRDLTVNVARPREDRRPGGGGGGGGGFRNGNRGGAGGGGGARPSQKRGGGSGDRRPSW